MSFSFGVSLVLIFILGITPANCIIYPLNFTALFWEPAVINPNSVSTLKLASIPKEQLHGISAKNITNGIPVYVSITAIAQRLSRLNETIRTLLLGTVIPTKIYLFISRDPYLIDTGVKKFPVSLASLVVNYPMIISVVFVDNLGPHRKLIPILWKKWTEDCIIITFDDDLKFSRNSIQISELLKYDQLSNGQAIISPRPRRMTMCYQYPYKLSKYSHWPVITALGSKEMLLLPTGTGGVLYRPRYFHPIIFDDKLRNITGTADDIMFRLATLPNDIPVVVGCRTKKCSIKENIKIYIPNGKPKNQKNKSIIKIINHSINSINTNTNIQRRNLKSTSSNSKKIIIIDPSYKNLNSFNLMDSRNDEQLRLGLEYLHMKGILNFPNLVKKYIKLERPDISVCFTYTNATKRGTGKGLKKKNGYFARKCSLEMC